MNVKNIFSIGFGLLIALLSSSASAQLVFCQLLASGQDHVSGQSEPAQRGKILAQINKARLPAGESCDSWRARIQKDLVAGGCELLATGKQIFEGFGSEPPKRGTVIARGLPKQGQTCDAWRDEKASTLLVGIVD